MNLFSAFPFAIGFLVVLQAGLNRLIGTKHGFLTAGLINSTILLISIGIWFSISEEKGKLSLADFRWWFLIPGLCGACLVLGMPFAIAKIGAVRVFVTFVAAQLIGSLIWDYVVDGQEANWQRLLGTALAFAGVWLASYRNS